MAFDDEDRLAQSPRRAVAIHHEIGQILDSLSVAELDERLTLLAEEISRLQQAKATKLASMAAASAFFK